MRLFQTGNKNYTNLTHIVNNTEWIIYGTCANIKKVREVKVSLSFEF
jgi:hypothetical protein